MSSVPSLTEQLQAHLYAWERRGRGWDCFDAPVRLEPPFRPLWPDTSATALPAPADDGRRATFLSCLASFFTGRPSVPAAPAPDEVVFAEPLPDVDDDCEAFSEFQVLLPQGFALRPAAAEELLSVLGSYGPVSFEFVGTGGEVVLLLSCRKPVEGLVAAQIAAFAPDAVVLKSAAELSKRWFQEEDGARLIFELGLGRPWYLPLRVFGEFAADPLTPVVAALSEVGERECAVLQVLFTETTAAWGQEVRSLIAAAGEVLPPDGRETAPAASRKAGLPLLAAVVRVAVRVPAGGEARALSVARSLVRAISLCSSPAGNELIPLEVPEDFPVAWGVADLLFRRSHRTGMLLSAPELAALVHLPGAAVRHPALVRYTRKTKPAPAALAGTDGVLLGENRHAGVAVPVRVSLEQRLRHIYVIGATGTGKSTLLTSLICQDIEAGQGVGLLDPHGDLVDEVLARLPPERVGDVVLFDPADADFPVAFNILHAHSDLERELLASDLVSIFRRLSTSWGDQMNSVLANSILALLEHPEGGTLLDLRRFLVDREFRARFLAGVPDPEVRYYWQHEFPLLSGKPQAPILTRLDAFLRPKLIRNIVAQRESRLDFGEILASGKIFLARLSGGLIGEENASLLGALLVSKINQMAFARQAEDASERRPFFLYLDEFHHFITPSMAALLTGVRKYKVGLTLAHQDREQLLARDREVAASVMGSAATRVVFRVSESDARALAEGFSGFEPSDLTNLGIGEAVCRVERAEHDFNLHTAPLPAIATEVSQARRAAVIEASRKRYGTLRSEAEAARQQMQEPIPAPVSESEAAVPAVPPAPAAETRSSPPVAPPKARPVAMPATPGRGGQYHKYLQSLISRIGQARGFRATVEQEIHGGHGKVDVALESDNLRVACEISVTTTIEHELGNVQKCLSAGFDWVLLVLTDKSSLKKAQGMVSGAVPEEMQERVRCVASEDVAAVLEELLASTGAAQQVVAGYKVVVRQGQAPAESPGRMQAVREVLARSLSRLRKG